MNNVLVKLTLVLFCLKNTILACDYVDGEWVFQSRGNNFQCKSMCRCQEVDKICMRGCEECCIVTKNIAERFRNQTLETSSKLNSSIQVSEPNDLLWLLFLFIGIALGMVITALYYNKIRITTLFCNCLRKVTEKSEQDLDPTKSPLTHNIVKKTETNSKKEAEKNAVKNTNTENKQTSPVPYTLPVQINPYNIEIVIPKEPKNNCNGIVGGTRVTVAKTGTSVEETNWNNISLLFRSIERQVSGGSLKETFII